MDYIKQLNAFELWLETNHLPGTAQMIWYKLFMLFNRCGWSEWVIVDNRRLMVLADIKSETTFINARNKLVENGLIESQKGRKGSPNRYKLKRLYAIENVKSPNNGTHSVCTPINGAQTELKRSTNDSQNGAKTVNINKLNKTKEKEKDLLCPKSDKPTSGRANEKPRGDKKQYSHDHQYYKAANWLKERVYENSPRKMQEITERQLQQWADVLRLMEERDRIPFGDIRATLMWCVTDNFWRTNILSMNTFREKYNQLVAKMDRPLKPSGRQNLEIGNYNNYPKAEDLIDETET